MTLFKRIADNRNQGSLAARARRKRFAFFGELLETVPRPLRMLDVGGTQDYWEAMDFADEQDIDVTLLNLTKPRTSHRNFRGVAGDATDMAEFFDDEFDVVFSNSVIEHVGDYLRQSRMACEVQRVGKRYFVQTPNYSFPIEPHFLLPAFHWLPQSTRVWLLRRYDLGWIKRMQNEDKARKQVESIRLLRKNELLALFPGATLYEERVFGLVKSFVVYGGW